MTAPPGPRRRGVTVALATAALVLAGSCGGEEPPDEGPQLGAPASAEALDTLLAAVDATRAVGSGAYLAEGPLGGSAGVYDRQGVSVRADGRPEIRVAGSNAYLPAELFPKVNSDTPWLWVSLADLAPLENRSPGLADEVAALSGAAPPGVGPPLAAVRTATEAAEAAEGDSGSLRAILNLSDLDAVAPRDQDAVVAWTALWSRSGGARRVLAVISLDDRGRIEQVVLDPDGDTPAGPWKLSLSQLGRPQTVPTPRGDQITRLP
ncbi:MAG: hypothetical protein R2754_08245 [Microthrixaceae bacterium]